MSCTSGCPTPGAHQSWGECLREKGTRVGYCGVGGQDYTAQKRLDSDLAAYRAARKQGIQPAGTGRDAVDRAMDISERTGVAYQA